MSTPDNSARPYRPRWQYAVNALLAAPIVTGLLLFVPAGDITWLQGWLFLTVLEVLFLASILYIWRVNPELFPARRRIQKGTKRWDRVLLAFLAPTVLATVPVAGLDGGRFHWSHVSWWVVGLGYLLLTAGWTISAWAEGVNRFFEPGVRIQTERGHHVVDTGPYAVIRHPGYFGALFLLSGVALSLGSWWALVPAGVASGILVIRTAWEDRTLHAELPGYAEYAQRVRYRLIPGVW